MKTPLRTLTCALAAASAIAAVPAGANPGPQRATGGPGASALLKSGVLTMHWRGGSARIDRPARLPASGRDDPRRGRGPLVRRQDGDPLLLAAGRGRALALPVAENGKLTPLAFRGTVTFDAIAPRGSAIFLTRRASATDATKYTVLVYGRAQKTLNPVATKVVFSAEGAGGGRAGGRCRASR